ncbi:energy-coupling factor transporter transmembrane component T family protein [Gracilinema caldarium]|uniref:ABC-type transporter, integral membrane subunit n=1 Tax=Gracilinema caldarium (strain ATCC 51460 / DSM 7334 / H1) TaxID=744872 RepID=F8F2R0_GRAC1|nr:energy-coupling factor transporter transmembrane protein EcfT [Gracilinema caldarium]AEJ19454.1 ABC-type transporter, integral membrane subunit [Gracilinema caldarium DSM 7334]
MAHSIAFEYTPVAGPLHRLHPILKLAFMAGISLGALGQDTLVLILITFGVIIVARWGKIPIQKLFVGSKPLLVTTTIIILFSAVNLHPLNCDSKALYGGLRFLWAIGISFAAASLFFYTTKLTELREALETLENPLLRSQPHYLRFSLLFTLTMGFIPRIFFEWSEAEDAWLARGGKKGLQMMILLIPSVLERLIMSAKETAHALELRIGR